MNKSFVLKPFRATTVTRETAEEYLAKLRSAIVKIHRQEGYSMSFEELYR